MGAQSFEQVREKVTSIVLTTPEERMDVEEEKRPELERLDEALIERRERTIELEELVRLRWLWLTIVRLPPELTA